MRTCRLFYLMVSKHLKKQSKQKLTIFAGIILSLLFSLFIVLLRFAPEILDIEIDIFGVGAIQYKLWWKTLIEKINTRREHMIKEQQSFKSNVFIPKIIIAYAPNSSDGIRKLIESALNDMSMTTEQILSFSSCEELRIHAHMEHYIASVCFHSIDETHFGLPHRLNYSIIMPSELRYYEDTWIGDNWKVNHMFETYPEWYISITNATIVGSFVREGFVSLQYYISIEYLQMASGNATIPEVSLSNFNLEETIDDFISENVNTTVIVVLIGFMFPITILTKEIVEDRELNLHNSLIKNANETLCQFATWCFNGCCQLFVSCIIFTLVLKIEWSGNQSVFRKCPWHLIIFFFISFMVAAVAFSLLIAIILRTTKMVMVIVPIFWIVAILPLLTGHRFMDLDTSFSSFMVIIGSYVFCNMSMCRGLKKILILEHHSEYLSVKEYLMSTIIIKEPPLLTFIGIFYIQAIFYILIAVILDGHICSCLLQCVNCTPCRLLWLRTRHWIKRRKRRKRKRKENEVEIRSWRSRDDYDFAKENEQLTQTVQLLQKQANKLLPTKLAPPPDKSTIETNGSDESISSTSESDDDDSPVAEQTVLDKQLLVWLSNTELAGRSKDLRGTENNTLKYYMQQYAKVDRPSDLSSDLDDDLDDAAKGPIVIEFDKIWKKYYKIFVVRNFSLKVHENEIVVILSHNGAGKTTLLNMACGHLLPNFGRILIEGYDVVKRPVRALQNVGVALQRINLFTQFTFTEHLIYFSRLRGLPLSQAQQEVNSYLHSFQLDDLAQLPITELTNGHQKLLHVLSSFAGRTKIVLLDAPMEGVDEDKRSLFADFVFREKTHRTILIATNEPGLASTLGDRVAILVNGNLFACEHEMRLLLRYTNVYRLYCYLGVQCKFEMIYNLFVYYIPGMELESKMGDTAVFLIDHSDMEQLYKLINVLTENKKELNLDSFKISSIGIVQLLLKAMMHRHVKATDYVAHSLPMLAKRIRRIEETKHLTKKRQFLADIVQLLLHIEVILRKRLIINLRNNIVPVLQFLLPGILCIWCLLQPHLHQERRLLPIKEMTINCFKNTITLVSRGGVSAPVQAASQYYLEHATLDQRIIEIDENVDTSTFIRRYMAEHKLITDLNFVVGALFTDQRIMGLYDNNVIHSTPVSLALIMNALAVGFVNPDAGISVQLELLPFSTMHSAYMASAMRSVDWVLFVTLTFYFCYAWALPLVGVGLARDSNYIRIEVISGMRAGTLIVANFIYDVLMLIASLIPMNAVILYYHSLLPMDIYNNIAIIYVILVAGICAMSLNIVISFWLTELRTYVVIIMLYSMCILIYMLTYTWQEKTFGYHIWELNFLPYYSLINNLIRINNISEIIDACADPQTYETSVHLEQCRTAPNCCNLPRVETMLLDITWNSYVLVLVSWVIIYMRINLNVPKLKPFSRCDDLTKDSDPDSCYDQSVLHFNHHNEPDDTWIHEKIRVRTLERSVVRSKALHVENLGVFFHTRVVLNHINFMVERFQIMAMVGRNGSGKTVMMKTILGAHPQSTGTISCYGKHSYQYSKRDNYKLVGYCAQTAAIKDALTVFEYIQTVLVIRGLSKATALKETNNLLKVFNMSHIRYHLVPNCSSGLLKRLNIAISLIGYAGVILMDDPFDCLDVSTRLNIFSLIQLQCSKGQAVLYSSSDPKCCNRANRIAILNRTSLCIVGERQDLQMEHLSAYIVVSARIQTRAMRRTASIRYRDRVSEISKCLINDENLCYFQACSIIEHFFPHAIIQSVTNCTVGFWLSTYSYTISFVLEQLHKNKEIFYSFRIGSPFLRAILNEAAEEHKITNEIIEIEDT